MNAPSPLEELVRSYLDLQWSLDPVAATGAGLVEHDQRLGSFGEDDVRRHVVALKSIAGSLEETTVESLGDEVDRTALLGEVRASIHRFELETPHVRNPTFWISHAFDGLYLLLALRDRPVEHVARSVEARLRCLPDYLTLARATLRDCPRVFVETAINVSDAGRALVEEACARLGPSAGPELGSACAEATRAVDGFATHLRDALLDAGTDGYAIGEEGFNFRLHFQHALRATAPELWRYGLGLIEEVEARLATAAGDLDGAVPWRAVVERLRSDHPAAEELVAAYAAKVERARRFIEERGLVTVPEGRLDVMATPSFLRPLIPLAAYQPPGIFASDRTGWFYVTAPAAAADAGVRDRLLRDHCVHDLASTALHEAFPGHHLQFLAAHALPRLARKVVMTPLTIEGWALYCEDMMAEEGFYATPEERLFQLVALLFRACRVVVDVGLHTRGMSIEEAVRLLTDRVGIDRSVAFLEVQRYCAEPTYQLSYAVGRRELLSLRDAYRQAHGSDYTLRGFHDAVLAFGGLPVTLMRWGMGLEE